jgi:hypothetical protein
MKTIVYVALVCVLVMYLAYLTGFYPLEVAILALAAMAWAAFGQLSPSKRRPPPREPWYMRE